MSKRARTRGQDARECPAGYRGHSTTRTGFSLPPQLPVSCGRMKIEELIQAEADHCVKCGLCLPRCPTYLKTRDEGDSPRGRIALLQGLAAGELQDSPALRRHLDGCLGCRGCERACPSTVAYGRLLDAGRSLLARSVPDARPSRHERLLMHPRAAARLLWWYRRSGLQRLARRLGLPARLGVAREDRYLPAPPRRRLHRAYYPPRGRRPGKGQGEAGDVALFTGCAGWIFDQDALVAAVGLLRAQGYGVRIPRSQGCCGALHLHRGNAAGARALAAANTACFNDLPVEAVLFLASGCGATLSEYGELHRLAGGTPLQWRVPVVELSRFLAARPWPETAFRPLSGKALVHEPCTLRHVLRDEAHAYALLRRIPGLEIEPLPDNHLCCGAAGDYLFREPAMADALLADKIAHLRDSRARWLLTSNIGCSLHLRRGIEEAGLSVEVLHPVELLARQADTTATGPPPL